MLVGCIHGVVVCFGCFVGFGGFCFVWVLFVFVFPAAVVFLHPCVSLKLTRGDGACQQVPEVEEPIPRRWGCPSALVA